MQVLSGGGVRQAAVTRLLLRRCKSFLAWPELSSQFPRRQAPRTRARRVGVILANDNVAGKTVAAGSDMVGDNAAMCEAESGITSKRARAGRAC
ncbi:hypothetical protein PF003_g34240 [Phytophthora fragariae]|nr:hypothetical protein PF003_g34240 [Phytophthora fragariae]